MRSITKAHARLPLRNASRRLLSSTSSASNSSNNTTTSQATPSSAQSTTPTTNPISSLLIANRGEIALRIHRTATRLGIPTTTIFTDVDRHSQHAAASPSSIALGSDPRAYLDGDRISRLAADKLGPGVALHPGYGFLSENAAFARLCADRGVNFVGPPASAMADMGDKARSKHIMSDAGVPCVPGYHGEEQSATFLAEKAAEIEYPVLLKSVKGGGGKGMRIVASAAEFDAQLRSARAEARASFGPDGEIMLVEKYITRPRHVEVQVFADRHGGCVALGERDCSIQRRHQKVIEESPAPGLSEELRQDLWAKARTAALAVGYVGAGTVEFILDRDTDRFYFMEMNTRLQVEHPVSEMVTGTDLVEWQLRVAAGERLPMTQAEIEQKMAERGWAIEARIYAENPEKGFMPDSGKLLHLVTPKTDTEVHRPEDAAVRIDAGFVEGDTVSQAYDGMIAKLIVRGADRETAIKRMELALRKYEVVGLSTNIEFLKRLCRSPAFIQGDLDTGYIDRWREELFQPRRVEDEVFVQAALGLLAPVKQTVQQMGLGAHGETLGFGEAAASTGERRFAFKVTDGYAEQAAEGKGEDVVEVTLTQRGNNLYNARVARRGEQTPVEFDNVASEPTESSSIKTKVKSFFPLSRVESTVVRDPNSDKITVFQLGTKTDLSLVQPGWFDKALGLKEAAASVVAPMPCRIMRVEVAEGDSVEKGTPLVVIESMKMETVIRSPQAGVVKKLAHKEGDICKAGTVLVLFEEDGAEQS
ncbi:uncharacterized protein PpBr36_09648 [Pyricularia pennisetigena]|uniref:uncharacterized protein n=1 Tax=Pyricularia pennisetigena TaxID=1578925 RepID=UPI001150DD06|nr:uncharacterized protein PpBr36_09648 [Pyricularia pennisetigena]TLS21702.1 hypothetical protein PpBr36_09648 [Pyricularia pennisetigena]